MRATECTIMPVRTLGAGGIENAQVGIIARTPRDERKLVVPQRRKNGVSGRGKSVRGRRASFCLVW